jgi:dolichol kinase
MPYIKAYRLPTPLLVFQLALIPGSLLTGFLLSPLLVLSRKIAQRPAHRLRHPQEKELYRKAAGFYLGAAAICGGLIGFWAKWLLDWRDPWVWVALWLMEGRRWWARPALIAYWGLLAAISVAGWTRQLGRARKRRAWSAVTNSNGHSKISVQSSAAQAGLSHQQMHLKANPVPEAGFGHVAAQMMDAANQKLPVLSINARRKFFHALATAMFVPGIIIDVSLAFLFRFYAENAVPVARFHAFGILSCICRIQLYRVHQILRSISFRRRSAPVSKRILG